MWAYVTFDLLGSALRTRAPGRPPFSTAAEAPSGTLPIGNEPVCRIPTSGSVLKDERREVGWALSSHLPFLLECF